jgi:hypothetical protein
MDLFPYKIVGKLTWSSFWRSFTHGILALALLEFWSVVLHALFSDFRADLVGNFVAAIVIVTTQFLVGLYNDPEPPQK